MHLPPAQKAEAVLETPVKAVPTESCGTFSTASGLYPYKKLDFDSYEIRILTLNLTDKADISCSMDHVSLIDPGSYVALSYCWGDASATHTTISIGSSRIRVTPNLYTALSGVREASAKDIGRRSLRLWVDALCINQGDNEERSNQVRNMCQIYSRATEVVCCVMGLEKGARSLPVSIDDSDGLSDSPQMVKKGLDAFAKFKDPYWRRVWVIEEIAVAPKVIFHYSGAVIPWEFFAMSMKSQTKSHQDPLTAAEHRKSSSHAFHLLEFRERFLKRESIAILDAMQWSGHTLSTDPRDKIYALLGLCHDGSTFVPLPNYKQPLEVVINDIVRTMMRSNRSLDLMCLKGTSRPSKLALPSWTPDLTNFWSGSTTIQEATFDQWQTAYSFNPILEESNSRILKVKGKLLGVISRLTTGMRSDGICDPQQTFQNPWITSTSKMADRKTSLRDASEPTIHRRDRIWETLTMGLLRESQNPGKLRSCFSTLWRPKGRGAVHNLAFIAWIDQNAWFNMRKRTLREWSQTRSEEEFGFYLEGLKLESTANDFEVFVNTLERVLASGMRLAAFENEELSVNTLSQICDMGMVHPDAEIDDEVYCIHGCSIPVVLRRVEGPDDNSQYRVIGGAYTLNTDKNYKNHDSSLVNAWDGDDDGHLIPQDVRILDLV